MTRCLFACSVGVCVGPLLAVAAIYVALMFGPDNLLEF